MTTPNPLDKKPSLLGGIMITGGAAVGAGLFALPVASAGMWFFWSIASMVTAWVLMYTASLYIMEATLHFKEGASFDTVVKETLGKWPNIINGLMLLFLLYILDYAFISGGGSIAQKVLISVTGLEFSQASSAIIFATIFSLVVWVGMHAVDRVVTVLFIGMIVTFFMTTGNLSFLIDFRNLVDFSSGGASPPLYFFILGALPFYLTSFGFYSIVPSLVKYYKQDGKAIKRCMFIGSTICLILYFLWIMVTMGTLSREEFIPVIEKGGNVAVLIGAILQSTDSQSLVTFLNLFANFGLISSFLGVSIGLFDYIADRFGFDDTKQGRFKSGLLTFLPPTIGGAFFPDGFVQAIGFAGLILAINGLIIPSLVLLKTRKMFKDAIHWTKGGTPMIWFMVFAGVVLSLVKVMVIMNLLPVYPS